MNELLKYKNILITIIIIVVFAIVAKNLNDDFIAKKEELKLK